MVSRSINANNRRGTNMVSYDGKITPYEEFRKIYTPLWAKGTLRYHLGNGRAIEWCMDWYWKTRGVRPTERGAEAPLHGDDQLGSGIGA
jgi:hypothetical protein